MPLLILGKDRIERPRSQMAFEILRRRRTFNDSHRCVSDNSEVPTGARLCTSALKRENINHIHCKIYKSSTEWRWMIGNVKIYYITFSFRFWNTDHDASENSQWKLDRSFYLYTDRSTLHTRQFIQFSWLSKKTLYSYLLALLLLRFDYGASFILKSYRFGLALVQYTSVILPCISSKT